MFKIYNWWDKEIIFEGSYHHLLFFIYFRIAGLYSYGWYRNPKKSVKEIIETLSRVRKRFGHSFNDKNGTCLIKYRPVDDLLHGEINKQEHYVSVTYFIYDSYGRIMNVPNIFDDILEIVRINNEFPVPENYFKPVKYRHFSFGSKCRRTHYFRAPKTFQERKLSCDKDIKEFIRCSRNKTHLPNSWCDIRRSNYNNRSWKNNKKRKQWM